MLKKVLFGTIMLLLALLAMPAETVDSVHTEYATWGGTMSYPLINGHEHKLMVLRTDAAERLYWDVTKGSPVGLPVPSRVMVQYTKTERRDLLGFTVGSYCNVTQLEEAMVRR
jgi:hypothetical protein